MIAGLITGGVGALAAIITIWILRRQVVSARAERDQAQRDQRLAAIELAAVSAHAADQAHRLEAVADQLRQRAHAAEEASITHAEQSGNPGELARLLDLAGRGDGLVQPAPGRGAVPAADRELHPRGPAGGAKLGDGKR